MTLIEELEYLKNPLAHRDHNAAIDACISIVKSRLALDAPEVVDVVAEAVRRVDLNGSGVMLSPSTAVLVSTAAISAIKQALSGDKGE